MTFRERYERSESWSEKVTIMELFHIQMKERQHWNMRKTAKYFDVSLALVGENIRLARAIHANEKVAELKDRKTALLSNDYKSVETYQR